MLVVANADVMKSILIACRMFCVGVILNSWMNISAMAQSSVIGR